jgi:hypothetical protein
MGVSPMFFFSEGMGETPMLRINSKVLFVVWDFEIQTGNDISW